MGPVIREQSRCMSGVMCLRTDDCGVGRFGRTMQKGDLTQVYYSSKQRGLHANGRRPVETGKEESNIQRVDRK
jgi:hypothetical protein